MTSPKPESTPTRLDSLLLSAGYYRSRDEARRGILAGEVVIEGQGGRVTPGMRVSDPGKIRVTRKTTAFVSRGGEKLSAALDAWSLDVSGVLALDVGASTGGFTDCLMQRGAEHVVALDVGYGQLDWKLRQDPRVTVLERTNARHLDPETLPYAPDLIVVDVSFISLRLVIPPLLAALSPRGIIIVLVKPQFEAGKGRVGKGGVVRDPQVHLEVLRDLVGWLRSAGIAVKGIVRSPLKGPAGNIEFLMLLEPGEGWPEDGELERIVEEAWSE